MARKQKTPALTLKLDGKITADKFVQAVESFIELVDDVAAQVMADPAVRAVPVRGERIKKLQWVVSVTKGSINLAVAPDTVTPASRAAVRAVSSGLRQVGKRAERPKYFTDAALNRARDLATLTDSNLTMAAVKAAPSTGKPLSLLPVIAQNVTSILASHIKDYGSIEGRLEMISLRNGPHFTIYDALTDKGIQCHIPTDKLDEVWQSFGKRIAVSGLIRYRRTSGEPLSIEVEELRTFPDRSRLPTANDVYGIFGQAE